ncbi:hypothetical protein PVAND_005436 [Polypedilum vanderplanki]|uniref:Uncharacterized protein n=1 Tax=Polypedilum vanderplanki TaxID=319348 RepID=A0A9J6C063_POLVA|nr:hypothetical protein PVAND_005436 [Polypedilum vanderplanki]
MVKIHSAFVDKNNILKLENELGIVKDKLKSSKIKIEYLKRKDKIEEKLRELYNNQNHQSSLHNTKNIIQHQNSFASLTRKPSFQLTQSKTSLSFENLTNYVKDSSSNSQIAKQTKIVIHDKIPSCTSFATCSKCKLLKGKISEETLKSLKSSPNLNLEKKNLEKQIDEVIKEQNSRYDSFMVSENNKPQEFVVYTTLGIDINNSLNTQGNENTVKEKEDQKEFNKENQKFILNENFKENETSETLENKSSVYSSIDDFNYCESYLESKYEIEKQNMVIHNLELEFREKFNNHYSNFELQKLRSKLDFEIKKLRKMVDYAVQKKRQNRDMHWGTIQIISLDLNQTYSKLSKSPIEDNLDRKSNNKKNSLLIIQKELQSMEQRIKKLNQHNNDLLKILKEICYNNVDSGILQQIKTAIINLLIRIAAIKNMFDKTHIKIHMYENLNN